MPASGLYLTKKELKDYGVIKKKKPRKRRKSYFQDNRTPKTAQFGIRSISEPPAFGMQINRSNDLANELTRLAIEKEELNKKEKAEKEKMNKESALTIVGAPAHPSAFRDDDAHESIFHLFNSFDQAKSVIDNRFRSIDNENRRINDRFKLLEAPSFRNPFPQNNKLTRDETSAHEEIPFSQPEPVLNDDNDLSDASHKTIISEVSYVPKPVKVNRFDDVAFINEIKNINNNLESEKSLLQKQKYDDVDFLNDMKKLQSHQPFTTNQTKIETSKSDNEELLKTDRSATPIKSRLRSTKKQMIVNPDDSDDGDVDDDIKPKFEPPQEKLKKTTKSKKSKKVNETPPIEDYEEPLPPKKLINNSIKPSGKYAKGFNTAEWHKRLLPIYEELHNKYRINEPTLYGLTQTEVIKLYQEKTGLNFYKDILQR